MGLVSASAPPRPVLADASYFVALFNKREAGHARCVEASERVFVPIVTCEACIAEALHLLDHAWPAVEAILTNIQRGEIAVPFRISQSAQAVLDLMRKYRDTAADFADACLMAMAGQLGTGDILTLDRDFKHYRWRRNRAFNLLIPLD
jgi:predicted nucleic acid-binding protein